MSIPLSQPSLTALERGYVEHALSTGWISGTGSYITRFEEALAQRIERSHVIACANGTVALEVALRALDVRAGDEVIVPALTFVAPAAAVRSVGATPVFADIHRDTWTIDPHEVAQKITRRTAAIIAVDLLGHPANFRHLKRIAEQHSIPLIEDAAQAHGALHEGQPCGSFGLISTFSFHANKAVTTGEGGCIATNDDALAHRIRTMINHGMIKDRPYWHEMVGTNARMTNLTAAIGLGQVERWDWLIRARNTVAGWYDRELAHLWRRPIASWAVEACWLYTLAHPSKPAILYALRQAGIDARSIWPALVDLPLYRPDNREDFRIARWVAHQAFWLPTFAEMTLEQVEQIASIVRTHTALPLGKKTEDSNGMSQDHRWIGRSAVSMQHRDPVQHGADRAVGTVGGPDRGEPAVGEPQ